jgi:tetratricopeptide (TPR) repeat protein
MECHYTREELWDAFLGLLTPERAAAVRRHFERGCVVCMQSTFEMLDELLGEPPGPAEEADTEAAPAAGEAREPDAYDLAIDRALGRALKVAGLVRKELARVPEALRFVAEKGASTFGREAPPRLRGLAGVEALLQKSWEVRYDDPHEMVFRAGLAVTWAERLDPERYGTTFFRDLQGRALIELGNAHRVADELEMAQKTLDEAARVLQEGTGDELLEARLCDVQASLHAARRVFAASSEALDTVYAIHQRRGDKHLAGRALISKGVYSGYAGKPDEGEKFISRGLELIDPKREPDLFRVAVHTLLYLIVEQGRFREARNLLFRHRPRFQAVGGKIALLKLRAIEGRIAAGLGKLDQAETIFREVRQGFHDERLGYKEALAALELAVVLRQAGRDAEARAVVLEASDAFLSLGVHREALAGMLVLRKASEAGLATPALLRSTIQFLIRAESHPDLAAEDFLVP